MDQDELVARLLELLRPRLRHGDQKAIAARMGIAPTTLSAYKTGRIKPTLERCAQLAREVGLELHIDLVPEGAAATQELGELAEVLAADDRARAERVLTVLPSLSPDARTTLDTLLAMWEAQATVPGSRASEEKH